MKKITRVSSRVDGINGATGAVLALSLPLLAAMILLAAGLQHAAAATVDSHADGAGSGTAQHKHKHLKAGKAREADIPSKPQGEVRALKNQ